MRRKLDCSRALSPPASRFIARSTTHQRASGRTGFESAQRAGHGFSRAIRLLLVFGFSRGGNFASSSDHDVILSVFLREASMHFSALNGSSPIKNGAPPERSVSPAA